MKSLNNLNSLLITFGVLIKKTFLFVTYGLITIKACGQGTVDFSNVSYTPPGVDAPVYHSDHVTPLSGPQFQAELLAGYSPYDITFTSTTPFDIQGYFFGGSPRIPGVAEGGIAWVQVKVWNTASGATFDLAQASGLPDSWWQSSVFTVQTGCPDCPPPSLPGPLSGLGFAPLYLNSVPEPSLISFLALVGTAGVLRWRTRH